MPINPLTFLFAGIATIVLGMLWYNPKTLGSAWMRMSNITPEQAERAKKRTWRSVIIGFLAAAWLAWVMRFVFAAFYVYEWRGALDVSFWLWAGFVAPILLGAVLWEGKPFSLYLINAGFWLVSLLIVGQILVLHF